MTSRELCAGLIVGLVAAAPSFAAESRYERYDFGTAGSPVLGGWTQITGTTTDPDAGFTNTRSATDVGSGGPLMQDFVFHSASTQFQRTLSNGQYIVQTALGRAGLGHSVTVTLEDETPFDVNFAANSFTYHYTLVDIADGKLNATVAAGPNAGSGGYAGGMIWNGLSITPATLRYDFGAGEADGWTEVAGGSAGQWLDWKGYGWRYSVSPANPAGGGDTADDAQTDFAFRSGAEPGDGDAFIVDLPNGAWTVSATVGRYDLNADVDLVLDGDGTVDGSDALLQFDTNTASNPVQTLTTNVLVENGRLVLDISAGANAGTSGYAAGWMLNSVEISPLIPEPASAVMLGLGGLCCLGRWHRQ